MVIRWQNYREAHNIHGDEQVSFDKRKQNQEADAKKYGPQKEKVHQNETNTKTAAVAAPCGSMSC